MIILSCIIARTCITLCRTLLYISAMFPTASSCTQVNIENSKIALPHLLRCRARADLQCEGKESRMRAGTVVYKIVLNKYDTKNNLLAERESGVRICSCKWLFSGYVQHPRYCKTTLKFLTRRNAGLTIVRLKFAFIVWNFEEKVLSFSNSSKQINFINLFKVLRNIDRLLSLHFHFARKESSRRTEFDISSTRYNIENNRSVICAARHIPRLIIRRLRAQLFGGGEGGRATRSTWQSSPSHSTRAIRVSRHVYHRVCNVSACLAAKSEINWRELLWLLHSQKRARPDVWATADRSHRSRPETIACTLPRDIYTFCESYDCESARWKCRNSSEFFTFFSNAKITYENREIRFRMRLTVNASSLHLTKRFSSKIVRVSEIKAIGKLHEIRIGNPSL